MKVNCLTLLAGAALTLFSAAAVRAEESAATALATEAATAPAAQPPTASIAPLAAAGDTASYYDDSDPVQDFIARAGVWAVHSSGSPTEIGQYQNVTQSSPMFDLDGILSDGQRSLNLSLQGSDNDTDDGRLHYFGPHLEADVDYQRFDHQLYQDSYAGFTTPALASQSSAATVNNRTTI